MKFAAQISPLLNLWNKNKHTLNKKTEKVFQVFSLFYNMSLPVVHDSTYISTVPVLRVIAKGIDVVPYKVMSHSQSMTNFVSQNLKILK